MLPITPLDNLPVTGTKLRTKHPSVSCLGSIHGSSISQAQRQSEAHTWSVASSFRACRGKFFTSQEETLPQWPVRIPQDYQQNIGKRTVGTQAASDALAGHHDITYNPDSAQA